MSKGLDINIPKLRDGKRHVKGFSFKPNISPQNCYASTWREWKRVPLPIFQIRKIHCQQLVPFIPANLSDDIIVPPEEIVNNLM